MRFRVVFALTGAALVLFTLALICGATAADAVTAVSSLPASDQVAAAATGQSESDTGTPVSSRNDSVASDVKQITPDLAGTATAVAKTQTAVARRIQTAIAGTATGIARTMTAAASAETAATGTPAPANLPARTPRPAVSRTVRSVNLVVGGSMTLVEVRVGNNHWTYELRLNLSLLPRGRYVYPVRFRAPGLPAHRSVITGPWFWLPRRTSFSRFGY